MKSFYLEGYGCSLNISETESIAGFLAINGFEKVSDFSRADFVIINTCSVKQVTEQRMLSKIKLLFAQKKKSSKLIVFGCLASAQHEMVANINKEIIVLDTNLSSLCRALGIKEAEFSPIVPKIKLRELISIIPASTGCLGSCTYCSARLARKELHSYPKESILRALENALQGDNVNASSKEIWLTSQDLGCYGFDIGSSLPELVKALLRVNGNYRLRLGMMNPNHFIRIKEELMPLFNDKRLYKFLHLPVQSGSDKILRKMNRKYSVKDFIKCIKYARECFPKITLSTDVIVGFPGETKKDFASTISLLKKIKPDIVNVSRYGKRQNTPAEKMAGQIPEKEKKRRSKVISKIADVFFSQKNRNLAGKDVICLVSERTRNGFNARTDEYTTVFVKKGFGKFVKARVLQVKAHYFVGEVVKELE